MHLWKTVDPVVVAIIFIAILVRAWSFGSIPPGLNQDEASTAYDAFALLHYGVDRIGFPFPVVLVSWGSGMYALAAFLAMPTIGLFSLTITAARLPHLVMGIVGMVVFLMLVRELTDKQTTRIAAFLIAICPWHIMLSRWGLDSNLFPTVFLLGVTCAVIAVRRPWFLLGAFSFFGLSLYAYGTAYVVVPVFLLLASPYALIQGFWKWKPFLWSCGVLALLGLPIGLFLLINSLHLPSIVTPVLSIPRLLGTPRYETMGNIHITDPQFFANVSQNLIDAFHLLLSQNDGLLWNALPDYGALYFITTPLILLGFGLLCEQCLRRRSTPASFLLAWCCAAVVLSAFVSVNINRINIALFPLLFCATLGLAFLRRHLFVFVPIVALYVLLFAGFIWSYFTVFPLQIGPMFFASFTDAIAAASQRPTDRVCVTDNVNMPYIFVLFANREDPRTFAATVQYNNPGAQFQSVRSFGRYTFGLDNCAGVPIDTYITKGDEINRFDGVQFSRQQFGEYAVLRKL